MNTSRFLLNSPIITIFSIHPLVKLLHRVKHLFLSSTGCLHDWCDELRDVSKSEERRPVGREEVKH